MASAASGSAGGSRVPVEERLFSLVLALLATDGGLTKSEILATVQGYRQRYDAGGDNQNLERQFERDKDDIRELGVPLETVESPGQAGNNQNLRYRIPRAGYELPSDVRFTPEETALVALASMVWQEGSMSAQSRRALTKLRSLGVAEGEPVLSYLPRLRMREAAFEPLSAAIDRSQAVRFHYLNPGRAAATERTVWPLALFSYEGRWHLYALEPGSGLNKTFLLRRIAGEVAETGESFQPPEGDQAAIALAELEQVRQERSAVVTVQPGSDADARLAKRRGATVLADGSIRLLTADFHILADELAAFGPELRVLEPPELVTAVRDRLEQTAVDHG